VYYGSVLEEYEGCVLGECIRGVYWGCVLGEYRRGV